MRTLLAFTPFLLACGADPVSYSAPVGINLKAKSGDVSGTAISEEKGITTESGNPYGAFVSDARTKLMRDPTRIEVESLNLLLGAQSTGVTKLEDVFTGSVNASMIMNDTNNTYNIGAVLNPMGLGPVALDVSLNSADVPALDFAKYLGGSFKVVLRGTAAPGFAAKGAEAELQLTFTYAAYD